MAKKISKIKLLSRAASIFIPEIFYLFKKGGVNSILSFFKLFKAALSGEKVVEYEDKGVLFFLIPPIPSIGFKRHLRLYTNRFILKNYNKFVGQTFIAVNRKCPFNCWYCSADNSSDNELSLDEIDIIIEIFKDWGVSTIVFTGGEPLLREDIDRLILKYSTDLSFVILTSGYGLNQERARRLKRNGLFAVSISLDHYEKKINDQNRGKEGAFDIALGAIKNAKDAGLYTVIQTVVTDALIQNNSIGRFIDFVENLGADELFLLEPLCTGRLFDTKRQIFLKEDKIDMLKSLHTRAGRGNDRLKIITSSYIEDPKKYGCGAGTQHIYVDTTGELWPCNFLPISLGNILVEPDIVRTRLNKYFGKPCSKCILKEYRQEFLNVYNKKLPLQFESIEHILKRRLNDNDRPPEVFR